MPSLQIQPLDIHDVSEGVAHGTEAAAQWFKELFPGERIAARDGSLIGPGVVGVELLNRIEIHEISSNGATAIGLACQSIEKLLFALRVCSCYSGQME